MLHHPNTEEARDGLRTHALASTYFMAKAVIGFRDMIPGLHGDMAKWIDGPSKRKLGLVPRDHLKTSVWTIANTVKRVSNNPNIRILLGNETATNAQHFLRRIEAVFERNALYQWLFPELVPDFSKVKKWSESEMLVPRTADYPESTVETIGVGGAVVSRHYNLLKLDDLVGKEASESGDVMKKVIDWYQYCESLLERPEDEIEVYGTRWAYSDLYSWIEKNEGEWLDRFYCSVFEQLTGKPIWEERFNVEQLRRIKQKVGAFKFSCQYLNKPFDPEGGSFRPEWLRHHTMRDGAIIPEGGDRRPIERNHLRTFMRIDPAISEKRGAARSAIIVDGVYKDERIFMLEAWAKRCDPFEMIDKAFEFQKEYDCDACGIESVAYQRILKPVFEREARARSVWINVVEMRPDSREKKENRIRGSITPYLRRGLISVDEDKHADFVEEYTQFPNGGTIDILDAFAYGPQVWGEPAEQVNEEAEEYQFEVTRNAVTGY